MGLLFIDCFFSLESLKSKTDRRRVKFFSVSAHLLFGGFAFQGFYERFTGYYERYLLYGAGFASGAQSRIAKRSTCRRNNRSRRGNHRTIVEPGRDFEGCNSTRRNAGDYAGRKRGRRLAFTRLRSVCDKGTMPDVRRRNRKCAIAPGDLRMSRSKNGGGRRVDQYSADASTQSPMRNYFR